METIVNWRAKMTPLEVKMASKIDPSEQPSSTL
jgi:hypothetical protein